MSRVQYLLSLSLVCSNVVTVVRSEDAEYWRRLGKADLLRYLELTPNTNIAKNIILFIGDGMGISTTMAARVLRGQLQNKTGEETVLEFEKFPYLAMAKVYTTDCQVPDSAGTTTAISSGVKTKTKILGLDDRASVNNCASSKGAEVKGILHWSEDAGKSTGLVSTARITDATAGAFYAHTPNRHWERAIDIPEAERNAGCRDIAYQLVMENNDIEVILGGGRRVFLPNTKNDPEYGSMNIHKQRQDGVDLIQEWGNDKRRRRKSYAYAWNKTAFDAIDQNTEYILGLFESNHMHYELERKTQDVSGEPSLAEMTKKAIQVLSKNQNGFFLMVEGARIDLAHHENLAKKSLYDTLAFEDAVKTAVDMTSERETLVVVTADHSHVFTVAGYPERGNDILGIAKPVLENPTLDNLPFTTLGYMNGPGYIRGSRDYRTDEEVIAEADIYEFILIAGDNYQQESGIPMDYETHSGEDVGIYARGPMAHLFSGVREQNYIPFVMAHAACIGNTGVPCSAGRTTQTSQVPCWQESSTKDYTNLAKSFNIYPKQVLVISFVVLFCL